jgi:Na+/H+-dicarboxylate symporter
MSLKNKLKSCLCNNILLVCIILAIFVGFSLGILIKQIKWTNPDPVLWFKLPGQLFIRSIELLILPVVFCGVVSAISSLNAKNSLRMTLTGFGLVIFTHILGTLCGLVGSLILVRLSAESNRLTVESNLANVKQKTLYDIVADILRNLIPRNIIKAATNQELTRYYPVGNKTGEFQRRVDSIEGTNILGVLTFGLFIGLATSVSGKKADSFREFIQSFNNVVVLTLRWLINAAPIGIMSLLIDAVLQIDNFGESFKRIGLFTLLCFSFILIYGVFGLSLLLFALIRKNPLVYYKCFLESALLGFATTSSVVCMQKSIDLSERHLKMDPRVSRFFIPFFSPLKRDGPCVFIVMACVFIATYSGVDLNAGQYAVIVIMTCILGLSVASIPSASIVTALVVLNAIDVNTSNIAILYTVEWLLDRFEKNLKFKTLKKKLPN